MLRPEDFFISEDFAVLEEETKAAFERLSQVEGLSQEQINEKVKKFREYQRYLIAANRVANIWGPKLDILKDENKDPNISLEKKKKNLETINKWQGIFAQLSDKKSELEAEAEAIRSIWESHPDIDKVPDDIWPEDMKAEGPPVVSSIVEKRNR